MELTRRQMLLIEYAIESELKNIEQGSADLYLAETDGIENDDEINAVVDKLHNELSAIVTMMHKAMEADEDKLEKAGTGNSWCGIQLPFLVGGREKPVVRLDKLLYCEVWEHPSLPMSGFVAVFEATNPATGVSGLLEWSYDDDCNNVVENVYVSCEGFEDTFGADGLSAWLPTDGMSDFGDKPDDVNFDEFQLYGD